MLFGQNPTDCGGVNHACSYIWPDGEEVPHQYRLASNDGCVRQPITLLGLDLLGFHSFVLMQFYH